MFHHTDIVSRDSFVRCWDFAYAQHLAESLERDGKGFVMTAYLERGKTIVWRNTMRIPHGNATNLPRV
jgi:hypothetical protein